MVDDRPDEPEPDAPGITRRPGHADAAGRHVWLRIGAPFLVFLAYLSLYLTIAGPTVFLQLLGLLILYILPPAGKETLIPLAVSTLPIAWWEVALFFFFFDLATGYALMTSYDHAKTLPWLGPWIDRFERVGSRQIAASRLMRRIGALGLLLFMILPFQGSGAISSTILGRGMGLGSVRTLAIVAAGSLVSSVAIAYAVFHLGVHVGGGLTDPWVLGLIVSLLVGITVLSILVSTRSLRAWSGRASEAKP